MKKSFTIDVYDHPDGGLRAALFEGNSFLFEVHAWTEYGVFQRLATVYAFAADSMNDSLNRRAD